MYRLFLTQIFDTIPKDCSIYLNNLEVALNAADYLAKDQSSLEVIVYQGNSAIKKFKNEINFLKYYGIQRVK